MARELAPVTSDLIGLTEGALGNLAFRTIDVGEDYLAASRGKFTIHSGTYRMGNARLPEMGTTVFAIETYTTATLPDDEREYRLHRLGITYGNTDIVDEISLDSGNVIDDGSIENYDKDQARERIVRALGAIVRKHLPVN